MAVMHSTTAAMAKGNQPPCGTCSVSLKSDYVARSNGLKPPAADEALQHMEKWSGNTCPAIASALQWPEGYMTVTSKTLDNPMHGTIGHPLAQHVDGCRLSLTAMTMRNMREEA